MVLELTNVGFCQKIDVMNKSLMGIAVLLGIIFVIASFVYFTTPANTLPNFFPGYETRVLTHHYKHGIGTLLLGVACFIFAWFQSGKKKSVNEEKN